MNKLTKQLVSLFLSVLMVIESGFNAGITGYATEKASSSDISVYAVKVLADLAEDVAYQTVEFGTPESSLNLPKTIYALASDEQAEHTEDEKVYAESASAYSGDTSKVAVDEITLKTVEGITAENKEEVSAEAAEETTAENKEETSAEAADRTTAENKEEASAEAAEETTAENKEEVSAEAAEETTAENKEEVSAEAAEETTAESKEEVSAEAAEETTAESKEEVSAEAAVETTAESKEEVSAEAVEETTAENKEETSAEAVEETTAENKEETSAEAADGTTAENREETSAEAVEETTAENKEKTSVEAAVEDTDEISSQNVATSSETSEATETEKKNAANTDPDFMTDEQKAAIVKLLSQDEEPEIKELEKKSGLNLSGYRVIKLPLSWEQDTAFGGEYDPKVPGVYRFTSVVKNEDKYVLYDDALPTISVKVLDEDSKPFSGTWTDEDADLEIIVTAPAGVFPADSVLKVEKIIEEKDNKKIEEAVEKTLDDDKSVKQSYSYDIKVTTPDGEEINPDTNDANKVKVTFKSQAIKEASLEEDQYISVYHFKDVDKEDVEKAAKAEDDEENSILGSIVDNVVSYVTKRDSGEKLEKPEYIEAKNPEEGDVEVSEREEAEVSEETETDSNEQKSSAPETDDSAQVTSEGELTVETKDFSVYTVAFYSNKNADLKAYYIVLSHDDTLNADYDSDDTITIRFKDTNNGDDQSKQKTVAALINDVEDNYDKFKEKVAQDPEDLKSLLEYGTLGREITVPASLKSFGIIADSDGVELDVVELHRGDATYTVHTDTNKEIDPDGYATFIGVTWDLQQEFYVKQDASELLGQKIRYEITGFGSNNGGTAYVYIPDKDNHTSVQTVIATSDKKSFEIAASVTNFTVEASDVIKVKPVTDARYTYTSSNVGSDGIASIDSGAPTTFEFKAIKDYQYEIDQTVLKNGASFATSNLDKITYTISGFLANKKLTIKNKDDGTETTKTTTGEGKLSFTVPASLKGFTIFAKEDTINSNAVVKVDSVKQANGGQNNIKLTTDISGENGYLSGRTGALELVFTVPVITYQIYKNDADPENPETKYKDVKNLTSVSSLFSVEGYVFKKATIDTYTGTIKRISNFQYENDKSKKVDINADSTVKLYYSKTTDYPVSVKTENVANGTQIKFILAGSDKDSSVSVKKTKDDESIAVSVNGDNREFTLTTGDDDEYEFTITAEEKEGLTLLVDCSNGATFWQGSGVGIDAITLNANIANKLFIEDRSPKVEVKKLWQDGGKNVNEKNSYVGDEVEKFMYLEYFIDGKSTKWERLTDESVLTAQNAAKSLSDADGGSIKNESVYPYTFTKKLFGNYVVYEESGVKTYPIRYRIAEEGQIKDMYYSKYEKEDGTEVNDSDPEATVLRNYEKKICTVSIIWHDKDALKDDNGNNIDRPSADELKKALSLYKVLKGKTDVNTTDGSGPEDLGTLDSLDGSGFERFIGLDTNGKTEDGQDLWTVSIEGFAYDKDNYPIYYYLTEKLDNLDNATTIGVEGNEIINRRYEPKYVNVGNTANIDTGVYSGGTLYNRLAGDTQFKVYKEWRDNVSNTDDRPKAEVIFYRTTSRGDDFWNELSPIQGADYTEIKKSIDNTNKKYELILPGEGKYIDAYNEDGVQLIYVGKEKMDPGKQHYIQKIKRRGSESLEDLTNVFVKNGDTLVNIIENKVTVTATKSWIGKAKQDLTAEVNLVLYSSRYNPELGNLAAEDINKVKEITLDGFSAEETSKSVSCSVEEFDENGDPLYYWFEEKGGRTKDKDGNWVPADTETIGGVTYFVTGDGYRYLQTVEKQIVGTRINTSITNRLVGNAELKLVKKFPAGLSGTDSTREFKFDVFQDTKKIGTIVRKYGTGEGAVKDLYRLDSNNEIAEQFTIGSMEDITNTGDSDTSHKFADIATISSFEQLIGSEETGLLPRYDSKGKEYTYSIFEHEDVEDRGYYPTMVNIITEEEYQQENITVTQPYRVTEKYLLDTVEISNHIGKEYLYSVYKEWLDGDDAESRESVTFILEKNFGDGWEPAEVDANGNAKEHVINPKAEKYSKYVLLEVPSSIVDEFNYWRETGKHSACDYTKDGVTKRIDFRVKETKLGDKSVFYYGDEGDTTTEQKFGVVDSEGHKSQEYLGHDWARFEGKEENFTDSTLAAQDFDYGFVQGDHFDYDVLVNDRTEGNRYRDYQYYEPEAEVANRNFDFALSNVRVGYIYIDITKVWHDGEDDAEVYKYRPDALKVRVQYTDYETGKLKTEDVTLNKANRWNYKIGPLRKYKANGELIPYDPQLISLDSGKIEDLIYNNRTEDENKYASLYVRSGSTKATFKAGEHHTGDVYSIKIENTITDTITPKIYKFWDDYDLVEDEVYPNKRPDIYTHIYRSYKDKAGYTHLEQLDKAGYVNHEWETVIDKSTHNAWKVTYSPMPRFNSHDNYCEYTYYITEEYASEDTNNYSEIGAFKKIPIVDEATGIASFEHDMAGRQEYTIEYVVENENGEIVTDGNGGVKTEKTTLVAVKLTKAEEGFETGTIVNSPRDKRTVSGVKIFDNIEEAYKLKSIPDITLALFRWKYADAAEKDISKGEQVYEYEEVTDNNGKKTLSPVKNEEGEYRYLYTVLPGGDSAEKRHFTFTVKDENGNDVTALVPKYDDTGRPYTYFVKEMYGTYDGEGKLYEEYTTESETGEKNQNQKILEQTFGLRSDWKETLTNGIEAHNDYKNEAQKYSITFHKQWDGLDYNTEKFFKTTPKDITVRLYRYMKDSNGNTDFSTEETIGDKVIKYKAGVTSVSWDNLAYYAPNLQPYVYVVSEKYVNYDTQHRSSRGYDAYEATVSSDGSLVSKGDPLTTTKHGDWTGYDIEVKDIRTNPEVAGTAYNEHVGLINHFKKETTELYIRKLWSEVPDYEGISVLPSKVNFNVYSVKNYSPTNLTYDGFVDTVTLYPDEWKATVSNLLKYEPQGWYYRYYVQEVDNADTPWQDRVFVVETKDDDTFWNGGAGRIHDGKTDKDGVIFDESTEDNPNADINRMVTGRKNVFKTISLTAKKKWTSSKGTEIDDLTTLHEMHAIPDTITYRVYYKDGDSAWKPLKVKNAEGTYDYVTMDSVYTVENRVGKYKDATIDGLLPYAFHEDSNDETYGGTYSAITYRAVEYSATYKGENNESVVKARTDIIDDTTVPAELLTNDPVSIELAGFEMVSSTEPKVVENKNSDDNKYHPFSLVTTITNSIDLTQLQVTKKWVDETRGYDGLIKYISFKLQSKVGNEDWKDAPEEGPYTVTLQKGTDWYNFENLPMKAYVNGQEYDYEYRAVETEIGLKNGKTIKMVDDSGNPVSGIYECTYVIEEGRPDAKYSKVLMTVLTNRLKLGSIVVKKNWIPEKDRYNVRPAKIKVELTSSMDLKSLLAPSIFSSTMTANLEFKTLNEANSWTATWSELPVYDTDGNKIKYTLTEHVLDSEDHEIDKTSWDCTEILVEDTEREVEKKTEKDPTATVTVDDDKKQAASPTKVTFTNKLPTTSFNVKKVWNTTDSTNTNADYDRYVYVELESSIDAENDGSGNWTKVKNYLNENGSRIQAGEDMWAILEGDEYTCTWDDLPKYDKNGKLFRYRAVEKYMETVRIIKDADGNPVKAVGVVSCMGNKQKFQWIDDQLDENGKYPAAEAKNKFKNVIDNISNSTQEINENFQYYTEPDLIGGYDFVSESSFAEDESQKTVLINTLKVGKYQLTKLWNDDDNRDGQRPKNVTFHLQRKLNDDEGWITLSNLDRTIEEGEDGKWSIASWSDLPVMDPNGDYYSYRASEVTVSGYEFRAEQNGNAALREGVVGAAVQAITDLYDRTANFVTGLLGMDNAETDDSYVDNGVTFEEGDLVKSTYSNIHKISTVDVSATKKWDDKDNKYGDRPKEITVKLYASYTDADGNTVEEPVNAAELQGEDKQIKGEVTLNASNNWTYTWTDLPEFKRGLVGARISYIVKENVIEGYTDETTVNVTEGTSGKKTFEITIKNTLTPRNIVVRKNWENEYAGIGKTVTGAEVVLQRKTEKTDWTNVYETVNGSRSLMIHVINKTDTSWTVTDLPVCDEAGNKYLYRAVESRIYLSDGSSVNVNAPELTNGTVGAYVYTSDTTETEAGFRTDITNRFDTASLKVSKTWSDENDKYKKRPQELKVTLKASTVVNGTTTDITIDGLKTETILNAANSWTDDTTWASVPVYTVDGKLIYYTFTEQNITDYKASYKSVSYGTEARTGDGTEAARVFTESGQVSEVVFSNSYTENGDNPPGGGNTPGGGSSGGGGSVRGTSRDNPSDSTDDGEVLGANRETPEVPEVLGATRRPQTGDESNMMYYGIGAIVSLAVLAAWFYADKKRKKAAKAK